MITKRKLALAAFTALGFSCTSAQAGVGVAVGFGSPHYYRPYCGYYPYRVYVAPPRPVYVYPVAPTYVYPAPVYVQPAPVAYIAPPPPLAPVASAPTQAPGPQPAAPY